ncbi:MAG: lytic transglycosylase domain-containing protein, partial [Pseudolabrys sp.]|nr:lytic transglycosylase domain-containing protein [Pseudolabrys sp.]
SAQASTSSAQGLYQFIDQTWLATKKRSGPSLGLGQFSAAIVQGPDGRFDVPDAGSRAAIMKMRTNPKVSAMMAGAYASNNAAQLTDGLGRAPSEGELYIAHFLGSDGANRLIGAALSAPQTKAATLFPQAAGANRSIFFDRSGNARNVVDVYRVLTGRYEVARAGGADKSTVTAVAAAAPLAAGPLRGSLSADAPTPRPAAVAAAAVPDTAGVTSAYASARTEKPRVADARPLFQSMFTTPQKGVSPVVTNVWMPAKAGADSAVQALDLFTDPKPPASRGGKV